VEHRGLVAETVACPFCATDNPERAKFCLECGRPLTGGPPGVSESRRIVTVLFSDIVGSTALGEALDPETLRVVMSRYFATMEAILERHGGTVEKFIGDAIMAVFGLRTIHEDDALRAVRAAVDMAEALAALNVDFQAERQVTIATRTGVHTGEVVAGDASARQTLVTGDAVNTAARLEQAAAAGEILIGEPTWRLVRDRVRTESIPAIGAKGKAAPVVAFRLLGVDLEADRRTLSPTEPLIGRAAELVLLKVAFDRVVAQRQVERVIVLGDAGVGKSHLIAEFLARASARATILRGHCLPYGEGITYWPIREIVLAAADVKDDDPAGMAAGKVADLVRDAEDGHLIGASLAGAIGLSAQPIRREEVFWAVRRMLEHLAATRPLIVLIEDLHWAEATLLELIDQVQSLIRDASVLVLCTGRPELADLAPEWRRSAPRSTTIELGGLPADAVAHLLDSLPGGRTIPATLRERIVASAEGNPLFVTEMVGMLVDDGLLAIGGDTATALDPGSVRIPPTIQALLAARVDRLPDTERGLSQRASIVGRVFGQDAVLELTPPDARPGIVNDLLGLIRRDLIEAETPDLDVVDAYRFRHVLIRDAAYDALRKTDRADLHRRFADWLERTAADRLAEYQEIVGYHLASAYRYKTELRELGPLTDELGDRAAGHLHVGARRARDRGDSAAALSLCGQAEALPIADSRRRAGVLLDEGLAASDVGQLSEAGRCAQEALRIALDIADLAAAARARLLRLDIWSVDGTFAALDPKVVAELEAARMDADASGDPRALAEAWFSMSIYSWADGRPTESAAEVRTATGYARAAGDLRLVAELERNALVMTFAGPSPATEVMTQALALMDRSAAYPTVRAEVEEILALSEAMLDRFEDAHRDVDRSIATLGALAQFGAQVNARTHKAWILRLAGDLPGCEAVLRAAVADAVALGDRSLESFASCRLTEALVNQGRYDEAEGPLSVAERDPVGATDTRIVGARARIRAARGDAGAATDVDTLLAMVAERPWPNVRTEAYIDAAYAMASLGSRSTAAAYAREALRLCQAKGNIPLARRTQALVDGLDHGWSPSA
jgi:class 3 adenylate cyclase